jgi:chitooligosaccharide synthase NodC
VLDLAVSILQVCLHWLFLGYGAVVLTHLLLQVGAASWFVRRAGRAHTEALARSALVRSWPSVDVLVPIYNEHPDDLALCCQSLLDAEYEGQLNVFLVDDGSPNRADVLPVLERFGALPGWTVVLPEQNRGKRHAQDAVLRLGRGKLVLTIDSDTQVAADAVTRLVEQFYDPRVGAATGSVRVSNAATNLLTRLIDLRYWVAFHQERASHSAFGAVLCCSGPLSMYRRSVLAKAWPLYVSQTFRGAPCTYGDDRHLTNLVLRAGWRTVFAPYAGCITAAPSTLPGYLRQQTRWNKSYYRELLWTLAFLPRLSRVMAVEVGLQALLPFLLTAAVLATAVRSVLEGPHVLVRYGLVIAVMAVLHCVFALVRTRDPRFLLFLVYGFLHAALLIPVRIRALLTLSDGAWGTREGVAVASGGEAVLPAQRSRTAPAAEPA